MLIRGVNGTLAVSRDFVNPARLKRVAVWWERVRRLPIWKGHLDYCHLLLICSYHGSVLLFLYFRINKHKQAVHELSFREQVTS